MNFILGMITMYLLIGFALSMIALNKDIKTGYAKKKKYSKYPVDTFFRVVILTSSWIILVVEEWK